jgi:hypothetical protein
MPMPGPLVAVGATVVVGAGVGVVERLTGSGASSVCDSAQ